MKFAFYLIVVVTSTFVNGSNVSTSVDHSSRTLSPTAAVTPTTTNVAASKGTSDPSPTTKKEAMSTSYHAILSNPTPKVTNTMTMYNQTSTDIYKSSLSTSKIAESVIKLSSMRSLTFAVSNTTTNTLLVKGSAKSSNAEGESKTPYSAIIVTKSIPIVRKTESVNQASVSIQSTGMISTTESSLRNTTVPIHTPSMATSITVSPTLNATTQSASMSAILNGAKTAQTKYTTTASKTESKSSLSFVSNMTTKPDVVTRTTSPVTSVNGYSSIMTDTTMVSTPNVEHVTGSLDVNDTISPVHEATSFTGNVTIPATPSVMVNYTMSSTMTVTVSPIIKNTSMKTILPISPATSVTPIASNESRAAKATINTTIMSNPTISITTSTTKSSPVVNGSISPMVTINTLSISNVSTSGLTPSAIGVSDTASMSIHPTNTMLSAVFQTTSRTAANLSTMPPNVTSPVETMNSSRSNTSSPPVTTSDGNDNKAVIVYVVFGTVLGLAFLTGIIGLIVRCQRERSTGMFHLPSEENLELSGFSGHTKSNFRGGNFYGDLQPESSDHRLTIIPNECDPVTNSLEGNTENGASFGGAHSPVRKSLQTIDISDVSRRDEDSSEMNDNPVLTYEKNNGEERRDSEENRDFVASYQNAGAV